MKTVKQDLQLDKDYVLVEKSVLDVFFPNLGTEDVPDYHAVCLNNGVIGPLCPNNKNSICVMGNIERPRAFYHAWDGKNCWKCPCG